MSIDAIVRAAQGSGVGHVVLTGGEPLLPAPASTLTRALRKAGLHVTIETAGTVDRDVQCDLISISPKFSSSAPDERAHPTWHRRHQERRMPIDTMRRLINRAADHQLKFVVDSPRDYPELLEIVSKLAADAGNVWIMPQGSTIEAMDRAATWLQPWCQDQGFQYCDRMQIRWYGNRRGT